MTFKAPHSAKIHCQYFLIKKGLQPFTEPLRKSPSFTLQLEGGLKVIEYTDLSLVSYCFQLVPSHGSKQLLLHIVPAVGA